MNTINVTKKIVGLRELVDSAGNDVTYIAAQLALEEANLDRIRYNLDELPEMKERFQEYFNEREEAFEAVEYARRQAEHLGIHWH